MECSFDYDIKEHVRTDLRKAIAAALGWMNAETILWITKNEVGANE
jgi:hypothetical protein